MGISQSSYADIENGISKIKVDDLLKIAQTLEVGIEDLLRDELSVQNIYNNNNNQNPTITNVAHNDFTNERKVWETLVESKNHTIQVLSSEIAFLKELLHKSN